MFRTSTFHCLAPGSGQIDSHGPKLRQGVKRHPRPPSGFLSPFGTTPKAASGHSVQLSDSRRPKAEILSLAVQGSLQLDHPGVLKE